jgi:hypothetical protein
MELGPEAARLAGHHLCVCRGGSGAAGGSGARISGTLLVRGRAAGWLAGAAWPPAQPNKPRPSTGTAHGGQIQYELVRLYEYDRDLHKARQTEGFDRKEIAIVFVLVSLANILLTAGSAMSDLSELT